MELQLISFQFPGISGVHCVFQKRSKTSAFDEFAGNFSYHVGDNPENVAKTRNDMMSALNGCGLENWTECKQVHGAEIIFEPEVTGIYGQDYPQADGLASIRPGLGLIIKTADCQPVLLAHESGKHIMALHCGWRGNRANFPGKAVREFCRRYCLAPEKLFAVRGPSLGPSHARFGDFANEWGDEFAPWFDGEKKLMNLWELTRYQLESAGLPASHIFGIDLCTLGNCDQFFSYRKNKNTGRQAAMIWIESKTATNA